MSSKQNLKREPKPIEERIATSIVTLRNKKKKGISAVIVTAYTYPEALLADQAGVDIILVGDSLGMTTQGYKSTIAVTMDDMISHCRGVWRANQKSFQIGDMPFMSYQESSKLAIRNAGRFLKEGGCDAVKIEGAMIDRVKAIVDSGIIVMSHLGLTPQSRAALGGYRVQGKSMDATEKILNDALKLQDAGCSFLLLEAMPKESAAIIANELSIPVYGVGAGDQVDGQLVILHDLIGMFFDFKSKFVKRYCDAGEMILEALKDYAYEVRTGKFPTKENFYEMNEDELEVMLQDPKWKYILEK
ncbi:MAG: 3-methyl-2-oxobutanoate hydroxymethyltransferase [Candidatus Marinimicrobia bacterium]|nr:3-methyl-2-oxobutanoate hydroxymethyltransferase [Candidatus Neomarinimicrobiota bacterium]